MPKGFSYTSTATALLALIFFSIPAASARAGDLEQEYLQVRKIALKDPRVQEAFAKANDRLNQRILEIDPSLKPIVDRQAHAPTPVPLQTHPAAVPGRPAAAPLASSHEHIVVKGETLDSIATHYRVRVAALERLNHIVDPRKLRIGQKLIIPGADTLATQPAQPAESLAPQPIPAASPEPAASATPTPSLWDRLKSGL